MANPVEKIIIVDKEDNVLSSKERSSVALTDIYRVSALWVTDLPDQLVLLARRSFNKSHDPGSWGPAVAGTVEEGETYDSNIIKEAEEELGLRNIKPVRGPKRLVSVEHTYFVQWFFLRLDKGVAKFKMEADAVEEIAWVSKADLLERLKKTPDEFTGSGSSWFEFLK